MESMVNEYDSRLMGIGRQVMALTSQDPEQVKAFLISVERLTWVNSIRPIPGCRTERQARITAGQVLCVNADEILKAERLGKVEADRENYTYYCVSMLAVLLQLIFAGHDAAFQAQPDREPEAGAEEA